MKVTGLLVSAGLLGCAAVVQAASLPVRWKVPARRGAAAAGNIKREDPRAAAAKEMFLHSWAGYSKYAFGYDELYPVSKKGGNSRNGWGASIVDALTTAILMELPEVVLQQLEFIKAIDFDQTKTDDLVSLFETTIRYLGGLVSGYDLLTGPYADLLPANSTDLVDSLLVQAVELGDALAFAFETPSGVPSNDLNFKTKSFTSTTNGLATTGTLVLEWTRLSDVTGDPKYAELAQKAESYLLHPNALGEPFPGMLGSDISLATGEFVNSAGGWSGGTDSFYEYLIKMYVYAPSKYGEYGDRWIAAADSTIKYLLAHPKTGNTDLTFVAEYRNNSTLSPNMGHLTCFIGGNFLMAGEVLGSVNYTAVGLAFTDGCHDTYAATTTQIGPERWSWNPNTVPDAQKAFYEKNGYYITAGYYDLRPEVIESYYYAYELVGDPKYRDWAWDALVAINGTCRTEVGFTAVDNVMTAGGGEKYDFQESFWFAEVLKYLYLIFAEDVPVGVKKGTQEWVFNTEAHPFKVLEA